MNFELTGVRYWKESFKNLKHFDILPYQKVVDLYLEVHEQLKPTQETFGWNERPINSDVDKIKKGESWDGFDPVYFNIDPTEEKVVMAKADVISMDMAGVGKEWNKFLYLTLEIAYLGKVSVVIIDLAASSIEFTKTGFLFLMQDDIFNGFNSSPITPVEDEKTSFSSQL